MKKNPEQVRFIIRTNTWQQPNDIPRRLYTCKKKADEYLQE